MPNPSNYHGRIRPDWQEIESVRDSAESFLKSKGLSGDIIESITMVISELTENAIKYGMPAETPPRSIIELSIEVKEQAIIIQVSNQLNTTDHNCFERLNNCINWIHRYENPFEAYVDRIKLIDASSNAKTSGLGLARIAYEGECAINCYLNECTVTVKATHRY